MFGKTTILPIGIFNGLSWECCSVMKVEILFNLFEIAFVYALSSLSGFSFFRSYPDMRNVNRCGVTAVI